MISPNLSVIKQCIRTDNYEVKEVFERDTFIEYLNSLNVAMDEMDIDMADDIKNMYQIVKPDMMIVSQIGVDEVDTTICEWIRNTQFMLQHPASRH